MGSWCGRSRGGGWGSRSLRARGGDLGLMIGLWRGGAGRRKGFRSPSSWALWGGRVEMAREGVRRCGDWERRAR